MDASDCVENRPDGKKKSRPVRSLTDEEYEEIFNAVLANCHTPVADTSQENDGLPLCKKTQSSEENMMTTKKFPVKKRILSAIENKVSAAPHHAHKAETSSKKKIRKISAEDFMLKRNVRDSPTVEHQAEEIGKVYQMESKPIKKVPKTSVKEIMQKRNVSATGTWVQCCIPDCGKWRYLKNMYDPSGLPKYWTCNMNHDEDYNSCSISEEQYDDTEHIFVKFTEGSLVWAKLTGFPWWPGMIEIDPDFGEYFECNRKENNASSYHVVFFADKVSRAWTSEENLRPFTSDRKSFHFDDKTKSRGVDYKKQLQTAVSKADDALDLNIEERLTELSFCRRYSGKWGNNSDSADCKQGSKRKRRELEKHGLKEKKQKIRRHEKVKNTEKPKKYTASSFFKTTASSIANKNATTSKATEEDNEQEEEMLETQTSPKSGNSEQNEGKSESSNMNRKMSSKNSVEKKIKENKIVTKKTDTEKVRNLFSAPKKTKQLETPTSQSVNVEDHEREDKKGNKKSVESYLFTKSDSIDYGKPSTAITEKNKKCEGKNAKSSGFKTKFKIPSPETSKNKTKKTNEKTVHKKESENKTEKITEVISTKKNVPHENKKENASQEDAMFLDLKVSQELHKDCSAGSKMLLDSPGSLKAGSTYHDSIDSSQPINKQSSQNSCDSLNFEE